MGVGLTHLLMITVATLANGMWRGLLGVHPRCIIVTRRWWWHRLLGVCSIMWMHTRLLNTMCHTSATVEVEEARSIVGTVHIADAGVEHSSHVVEAEQAEAA